jgi:superfamily II DNA or RNA helicase
MPLLYLKNPDPQEVTGQRNLGRFMRILLVKRLESSFYAFRMTLDRFINSYDSFIKMFDKGTIYISKKYSEKIYEALENDDIDIIMALVEQDKVQKYASTDFSKSFKENLEEDLAILLEIRKLWKEVAEDPKIDIFKSILKEDKILKENKLIIFTESKETADYLDKNLRQTFDTQVLSYSSKSGAAAREVIIENYDPRHKNQKNDIRILITTDILAEGVNLHRSNVVINYDIPWNPTRVLQRVGRVNRVDTKFDDIYVYNFFPTIQGNNEIKLEEAAIARFKLSMICLAKTPSI